MAIALQPRFPLPDRSKHSIRSAKDEDGVIDIGWCEGVLSDGRAFRAEMWAQDQVSMLTIFFSAVELEQIDQESMLRLVEAEHLVSFPAGEPRYCSSARWSDDAGNPMWSVNVVVGDDLQTFVTGSVPIFPYSKIGEPNTLFNPTPIKAAHAAPERPR
jgi:hypothetical protein